MTFEPPRRPIWRRAMAAGIAMTLGLAQTAQACTSFLLRTSDGGAVYGRTMEFGFKLTSEAIVIPLRLAFAGTGPRGMPGLIWQSR